MWATATPPPQRRKSASPSASISLSGGKVIRPARELKGFARVHLEAGEEKAVTIPFDEYTFRYFNVQTNKFEVEGGAYDILIAASSEDIRLRGTLEVRTTSAAWSPSSSVVRLTRPLRAASPI